MTVEGAAVDLTRLHCSPHTMVRQSAQGIQISSMEGVWGQSARVPIPPGDQWTRLDARCSVIAGQADVLVTTTAGAPVAREALEPGGAPHSVVALVPPLVAGGQLAIVSADPSGRPLVVHLAQIRLDPITGLGERASADALVAVHDVNIRAGTFAVVPFLLAAERERQARGARSLDLVILPGSRIAEQTLGEAYRRAYPPSVRRDFVERLIPAIARCLPATRSVEIAGDRKCGWDGLTDAEGLPFGVDLSAIPRSTPPVHADHRSAFGDPGLASGTGRLRAPDDAVTTVRSWLATVVRDCRGPVITVTLRSEAYLPDRNSDVAQWAAALTDVSAVVVLVPDPCIGAPLPPDGPWIVFPHATPGEQLALYELADVNLAQFGNHAMLLIGSTAPFAVWIPCTGPGALFTYAELDALGLAATSSPPFLMPGQRLFYSEPSSDALRRDGGLARLSRVGVPGSA